MIVQVGNLGLLFMLLFFIYAALGVELFGELGKNLHHTVYLSVYPSIYLCHFRIQLNGAGTNSFSPLNSFVCQFPYLIIVISWHCDVITSLTAAWYDFISLQGTDRRTSIFGCLSDERTFEEPRPGPWQFSSMWNSWQVLDIKQKIPSSHLLIHWTHRLLVKGSFRFQWIIKGSWLLKLGSTWTFKSSHRACSRLDEFG